MRLRFKLDCRLQNEAMTAKLLLEEKYLSFNNAYKIDVNSINQPGAARKSRNGPRQSSF